MKAIILAAGRGSRLHPFTENCPKCLTELGGETLIGRQITTLRDAGIDDILIGTGYRHEMLALPGTSQVHNPDWKTTNMVETLFRARAEFGDDLVVSYGDIVYEPRVISALLDSPHSISVVVDRQWRPYWEMRFEDPLSDAESLCLEADGRITNIGEKVSHMDQIQAQYMGLMRFRGPGIDALKKARDHLGEIQRPWMAERPVSKAYMTDLLTELILMGHAVHAVPVDGGWLEIDTVADLELARRLVSDEGLVSDEELGRPPMEAATP